MALGALESSSPISNLGTGTVYTRPCAIAKFQTESWAYFAFNEFHTNVLIAEEFTKDFQ